MKQIVLYLALVGVAALVSPASAETPNLSTVAAYTATAPNIDGVLNDSAWLTASRWGAKVVVDQDNLGTKITTRPRTAYIAYDAENLYVGIQISTADSSKLMTTASSWWSNDEVEVFLECPPLMKYYKVTVTASGERVEEAAGKGESYAAVGKTADSWTVELVMPFSTLGQSPKAGDKWRINIAGHQVADGDMWLTWNPTYGGFNNSARFGDLVFLAPGN